MTEIAAKTTVKFRLGRAVKNAVAPSRLSGTIVLKLFIITMLRLISRIL